MPKSADEKINSVAEVKTARDIARELRAGGMGCNCDLDNWEPEQTTGHSWVCRIHRAAIAETGGLLF